ncbi:hypothetical protein [Pedobacter nyackensis]|uniref:hypothetical protein n=1 Tax=Pedobacter nyackensis TaxID=475255 RepID=UPI00292EF1EF|nr:hypothetical protein [Pedobacter nyackensis]
MQIIITWQIVLFFLAVYFSVRYIYFAFYMWNAGYPDPFNPFSGLDSNQYWNSGYYNGRKDAISELKEVSNRLSDLMDNMQKDAERINEHPFVKSQAGHDREDSETFG